MAMASTERNDFYLKEYFSLKGMASTERNGYLKKELLHKKQQHSLKGMASNKRNGFHSKKCLPLKGMVSASDGFQKWFPLKEMVFTKRNDFH